MNLELLKERVRRGVPVKDQEIIEVIDALILEKEKNKPKPISEAPRDGTPVLMIRKGCQSEVGFFKHADGFKAWFPLSENAFHNWCSKPPTHFLNINNIELDNNDLG